MMSAKQTSYRFNGIYHNGALHLWYNVCFCKWTILIKRGAKMYYKTKYLSPIGALTLACDSEGKNLVGLWMDGQKYHGAGISEAMIPREDIALFDAAKIRQNSIGCCD